MEGLQAKQGQNSGHMVWERRAMEQEGLKGTEDLRVGNRSTMERDN